MCLKQKLNLLIELVEIGQMVVCLNLYLKYTCINSRVVKKVKKFNFNIKLNQVEKVKTNFIILNKCLLGEFTLLFYRNIFRKLKYH